MAYLTWYQNMNFALKLVKVNVLQNRILMKIYYN